MESEREAGVDRVIAFSDGVVAIAITLLILPLTEIERAEGATLASVAVDNSGALFAFALSPITPNSPTARQRLTAGNMS